MTRLACAAALGLLLAVTLLSAWPKPADAQDDTLRKAIEAAVRSAIEDTVRKAVDDAVKKALGDLKAAGAVSAAAPPVATPPVATPPVVVTAPVVAAPATAAKNADTNTRDAATKAATDRIGELIAASTPAAKIREATIDLAVPKSPAFAALGLTPDSVVRPGSLQGLGSSLLSGADPRGNIQTGVAVEFAPYLLAAGNTLSLGTYQTQYFERLAARTQFSLATAKGLNDEDKATRVALGLFMTPFDRGDPRNDKLLLACFKERMASANAGADMLMNEIPAIYRSSDLAAAEKRLSEGLAPLEQEARAQAETCREDARKRNWNNSAWTLGLAPTWTADTGNARDLKWSGLSLWSSASYGFEELSGLKDVAQVVGHVRYRGDEQAAAPEGNGGFLEQDTLTLAAQLRVAGIASDSTSWVRDLSVLAEAAYVEENRHRRATEKLFRYAAGFEYRILDNFYVDVTIGTEDGREDGRDARFGTFGLKWGYSTKPTLNPK